MKSFTTLEKSKITSIAIGGFDGVHIAHKALLSALDDDAGAMIVIHRGGEGLTPREERCLYHDRPCLFLELDEIRSMAPDKFIHYLEQIFPSLQKIVVGYDFRFGKDRSGDVHLLKTLFTGEVIVLNEICQDGISVHAKKIKSLLSAGEIITANALLGREYSLLGDIIAGQGLGKKELFATLNMQTEGFYLPKNGVYATRVMIEGTLYPAVSFIGNRLSTDGVFSIESHILEESFELKSHTIRLFFVSFIRENKKFESLEALKREIKRDINTAKIRL